MPSKVGPGSSTGCQQVFLGIIIREKSARRPHNLDFFLAAQLTCQLELQGLFVGFSVDRSHIHGLYISSRL